MGWNFELVSKNKQDELKNESLLLGIDCNWRSQGIGCYSFLNEIFGIEPSAELLGTNYNLYELKNIFDKHKNKYKEINNQDFINKFNKWINLGLKYDCKIDIY